MKNIRVSTKIIKQAILFSMIVLPFVLIGCLIEEVDQPSSVNAGEVFTVNLTIKDMNAEQSNVHKGVIAILVPEDWSFIDGSYNTTMGTGVMELDTSAIPVWGNIDTVINRPAGMKWINLLSDTGYLHNANMTYVASLHLRVGAANGTFNIGYLTTVNTTDMLSFINDKDVDQELSGTDTSMNHPVTVTGILPVELTSFNAATDKNGVNLNWETATEKNNRGFEVQRSSDKAGFAAVGFVEGKGTTSEKNSYSYLDKNITEGNYSYRLKQVDYDGSYEYSDEVEVSFSVPSKYELMSNYPNPFNPVTNIRFGIPVDAKVSVTLYNAVGEQVKVITNNNYAAGTHTLNLNASNLPSGTYIYTISAAGVDGSRFSQSRKMVLLK